MLIYGVGFLIREKKQRFEVIRGVHGIHQRVLHHPHDSNTRACESHSDTGVQSTGLHDS